MNNYLTILARNSPTSKGEHSFAYVIINGKCKTDRKREMQVKKYDEKKLEEIIKKIMFLRDIPGLAIAIAEGEQVLYAQGFGVMNVDTKEPVTPDTVFHMASVTKLFVGTAIMQLWEKNKIDLHKPVVEYLPYFQLKDDRYKKITVFQMLSHTSGMPDCDDYGWENPSYDEQAIERYLRSVKNLTLIGEPGDKCLYSNIAYEALGDIIAKVSGEVFEHYVQNHIFKPLKMFNSSLLTAERKDKNKIATPHIKDNDKKVVVSNVFPYNREHAPSSTLTSNVFDISCWGAANLNKGELEGVRILDSSTYDIMWNPVANINEREQIGLSWFLKSYRGYRFMGHEGTDIGFRASFGLIPEKNLSVIVCANIQSATTRKVLNAAFDWVLGFELEI